MGRTVRSSVLLQEEGNMINVYDCRLENRNVSKKTLEKGGLDLNGFLKLVHKVRFAPVLWFVVVVWITEAVSWCCSVRGLHCLLS